MKKERSIIVHVRVRPNASITQIKSTMADGTLKIDLAAPAEDGKANAELMRFLAAEFRVSSSCVHIVVGHSQRTKIVHIFCP